MHQQAVATPRELRRSEFLPFHVPTITDEEIAAVVDVLKSGWLTTGSKAKQFEEEFCAFVGAKHAVAVNSATAALHLGLAAVGIGEGDEVIVPTMTFAATAEVVAWLSLAVAIGPPTSSFITIWPHICAVWKRVQ